MPPPVPSFTPTWHTASYPAISPTKPATKASLTGKSVLITAGGGSIGSVAARSFAAAGAAHIALLSRNEDKLKSAASSVTAQHPGTKVSTYSADVLDKAAVDAAFADFAAKLGDKIDVVVSGAGWGRAEGLIKDTDAETWLGDLDVNLKGSFLVAQAALRHIADDGVLINLTSAMSFVPLPCVSAYSVGKEAAVRLFDLVQVENPRLRVINLHPGVVDSAMNRQNGIPSMDDVNLPADCIVWAASSEADFLKGKYVFANWDVEELVAKKDEIVGGKLLEMWLVGHPRLDISLDQLLEKHE